jgi:hypothetical protein
VVEIVLACDELLYAVQSKRREGHQQQKVRPVTLSLHLGKDGRTAYIITLESEVFQSSEVPVGRKQGSA